MRRKPYTQDDLQIRNSSAEEQFRTRVIYKDLRSICSKNGNLTLSEQRFLFTTTKYSVIDNDDPLSFDCCKEYIFYDLFSQHYSGFFKNGDVNGIEDEHNLKRFTLLSRYLYILAKNIGVYNKHKVISFMGCEIEFNTYSIAHILMGHYAEGLKPFITTTDHFYKSSQIHPESIPESLQRILTLIEKSEKLDTFSSTGLTKAFKIPLKINNQYYTLFLRQVTNQEKGKGNIKQLRIETFYPTRQEEEISDILQKFDEIELNENLSFFKLKGGLN